MEPKERYKTPEAQAFQANFGRLHDAIQQSELSSIAANLYSADVMSGDTMTDVSNDARDVSPRKNRLLLSVVTHLEENPREFDRMLEIFRQQLPASFHCILEDISDDRDDKKNTYMYNGVSSPRTKLRPPVSTLYGGNIAAIDIGTTSCSAAYCLKGDLENVKEKTKIITLDYCAHRSQQTPTSVLIDEEGAIIKFTTTIKAANGKECFLIEVIAIILHYIKHHIYRETDASDFNWVITVPAIWKPRAKQMMREAAYMAGIASNGPVIKKLTEIVRLGWDGMKTTPQKVDRSKISPDQLQLVLRPVAAALYCMHSINKSDIKSCVVADVGDETMDVSAITQSTSGATTIKVPFSPHGNTHGGRSITKAILELVEKLANDPDFWRLRHYDSELNGELHELEREIEKRKYEFENATYNKDLIVRLPYSFKYAISKYSDSDDSDYGPPISHSRRYADQVTENGVTLDGRRLKISYARMEEFFKPSVDAIISCIEKCLMKVKTEIETVFLVGRFGGCNYVYDKVKPEIEQHSCQVYKSPDDHTVVAGAVMFRKDPTVKNRKDANQDPEIFSARVANFTYGTSCYTNFNHKYGHSYDHHVHDDDGVAKCKGLFVPMVTAGETLDGDKVISKTFTPFKHGVVSMSFDILASMEKHPHYAYTPSGTLTPSICKLGEITVPMPDLSRDKRRKVKLTFDFSDTEIQVQAHDMTSGNKAAVVVDILDY